MNDIVKLLNEKSPLSQNVTKGIPVTIENVCRRIRERPESIGTWDKDVRAAAYQGLDEVSLKNIYDALFFNMIDGYHDEIQAEALFSLLEVISGNMKGQLHPIDETECNYTILYLVTATQSIISTIKDIDPKYLPKFERVFFNLILDLYIPSDTYDWILDQILPEDESAILWMMHHMYDTAFLSTIRNQIRECITTRFEDIETSNYAIAASYQATDLLFRYVWDLFSKRETRVDFVKSYHLSLRFGDLKRSIEGIVDLLSDDFHPNLVRYVVNEIYYIVATYPDYQPKIQKLILDNFRKYLDRNNPDMEHNRNTIRKMVDMTLNKLEPFYATSGVHITRDERWKFQEDLMNVLEIQYAQSQTEEPVQAQESYEGDSHFSSIDAALEALGGNEAKQKRAAGFFKKRNNITNGFIAYKHAQDSVDKQLSTMTQFIKERFTGNVRSELIEGKEFSMIGLLKKALTTSAIFSFSKIGALAYLIVSKYMGDKSKTSEKKKLLLELEEEIAIVDEKIGDAKADGNREAKYALMRTKNNLTNAYNRLKFGLTADDKSEKVTQNVLNKNRDANIRR